MWKNKTTNSGVSLLYTETFNFQNQYELLKIPTKSLCMLNH